MKKVVRLTESELVKIIENLTLGHELEEKKETSPDLQNWANTK